MNDLKELETSILEKLAAAYGHTSVEELIAESEADIKRLQTKAIVSTESVTVRLRQMLVLSIELKGDHAEDNTWTTGVVGALLEGRISILRELIDWMSLG